MRDFAHTVCFLLFLVNFGRNETSSKSPRAAKVEEPITRQNATKLLTADNSGW